MSVLAHTLQVLGLVLLNVVIGLLVVRWLWSLIAKLTEERPAIGCIGLPVIVLVTNISLAIWTIAGA